MVNYPIVFSPHHAPPGAPVGFVRSALVGTLALCSWLLTGTALGQSTGIDSLEARLPTLAADTNRVNALNRLAYAQRNSEYQRASLYAEEARVLSSKLRFLKGEVSALNTVGWVHYRKGNYQQAFGYALQSLKKNGPLGSKPEIARSLITMALVEIKQDHHPKAIEYLNRALVIGEETDDKLIRGRSLNNLSTIYYKQQNYPLALRYARQALENNRKADDPSSLCYSWRNLGNVYVKQGKANQARVCFFKSLKLANQTKNKYLRVTCLSGIGDVFELQGRFAQAIEYKMRAAKEAREADLRPDLEATYANLAGLFAKTNNWSSAYAYQQLYTATHDSLYNESNSHKITQLQAHYDASQKQAQIELLKREKALQEAEIRKQTLLRNSFFAGFGLFLILAFILYRSNRAKRKANAKLRRQNLEIQQQTKEIETQRDHLAEKGRQIQRALNENNEQKQELEALNATKDKFFSIVAHDLRGPLNTLAGFSDLLSLGLDCMTREEIESIAADLSKSVRNTVQLTNNLLTWARCQMNSVDFHPVTLDVSEAIAAMVNLLQPTAQQKGVGLLAETSPGLMALVDGEHLSFILRNLTSNAIKFTHSGGTVRVETSVQEGMIGVSVTDTGVGMSEERVNDVFRIDTHHSTAGTNEEKGTGLGLLLCKEFVEKNGGRICVTSRLGEGSTFGFTLQRSTVTV
ncbi:MAG: tetratricopeptide repeat-containing sensor histidine kinase [Ferruginibacter sp.]|nr:tetratricopeptide repeat-containing sensor histidine kinase [Cytophagales bacterium]